MLRVENVTTRILQGISFRVPEGRCVAIAGPSGSGKTTMLNAIAGALPYQGTIYLAGQRLDDLPPWQRPCRYLNQRLYLFPYLTVRGNLALAQYAAGLPRVKKEQMDLLEKENISYKVCPGVSSFCGAASALNAEYTLPGISQSVVITRMAGRTPVPEKESIESFAAHQATMVIFLSTGMLEELSKRLIEGGYQPETPAAIVYKATWEDEKVCRCKVKDLAVTAKENGITKTALIVVGEVLGGEYERSLLYHPEFTTEFRQGKGKEGAGNV